jgi:hypothetical protein
MQSRGSATVVFLALLGIMLVLIAAGEKSIFHFQRELKLTEKKEIERLNAQTNVGTNFQKISK